MVAIFADDDASPAEAKSIAVKIPETSFEVQVGKYLRLFPYQNTYDYMKQFTGGGKTREN